MRLRTLANGLRGGEVDPILRTTPPLDLGKLVRRARAVRLRARGLTYLLHRSLARLHRLRERRWATMEYVKLELRQLRGS